MTYGKPIKRRRFLSLAAASGVVAATAVVSPSATAQSRRGGRFRMAIASGSDTDLMNPAKGSDNFSNFLSFGQLRECLVDVGSDSVPRPALAESWDASSDARRWQFKLRRGVEFHNGKSLTAGDVAFSLELHLGKSSESIANSQ
jgi:peptide/nickel transport system substrate-binding protein